MSERERLYQLLDTVPDAKVSYLISYIQGLTADNAEVPNKETISAFKEGEQLLRNGTGQKFTSIDELFENLEL